MTFGGVLAGKGLEEQGSPGHCGLQVWVPFKGHPVWEGTAGHWRSACPVQVMSQFKVLLKTHIPPWGVRVTGQGQGGQPAVAASQTFTFSKWKESSHETHRDPGGVGSAAGTAGRCLRLQLYQLHAGGFQAITHLPALHSGWGGRPCILKSREAPEIPSCRTSPSFLLLTIVL